MAISTLKELTPDERKQAILRISQFILREPSANMRASIYRRLLEIGIYLDNGHSAGLDKILEIIEKEFFGIKLPENVAEEYLKQLEEENIVKAVNGSHLLEERERIQIDNYSKNALTLVSSCESSFLENVRQRVGDISEGDVEMLRDCFYRFIMLLVSRHIANTAKLLIKGTLSRISMSAEGNLIDASSGKITNDKIKEAIKATITQWLQSPDDPFIEYLFCMRQNFLCIEILNLDPDCRMLEREEFSRKNIFLDTNVLLSLVLQNEFHKQTEGLIGNTRKLGCSVYVTRRTLDEFGVVLDKARKLFKDVRATPYQLSTVGNTFIRAYGKMLLSGSSLSSAEYFDQFSNLEKMLKDRGVEIFEEEHKEIDELPEFSGLVEEVKQCFLKLRGRGKTDDVAQHDAFHLLLVKTLRGSKTGVILGPDFWFLSTDLTLSCCDGFLNKKFGFADRISPIMIADIWNEIISPFLIGMVQEKDLIEVLKSFVSSEFTPISETIDPETFARLEIDWTEYDWLEIEEILEITHQKFVLDYISRREELAKTGDMKSIEQLRSEFNITFSSMIGKISSRKIQQVRTRLEEKEKETEQLKLSVEKLEETKLRLRENLTSEQTLTLRMRYITGIAGIGLLAIGAILIALMKDTASWQVTGTYIAFLVIGAILLLMSIAPGQVSAVLGLNQKK